MPRKPHPVLVFSTRRPTCAPRSQGQASTERERLLWVALHCVQGLSYSAISKLAYVGAKRQTVRKAVERFLATGDLRPKRSGGRANCPGKLGPAGRLYLRVRTRARWSARAAGALNTCANAALTHATQTLADLNPQLTLPEFRARLANDLGVAVAESTICVALQLVRRSSKLHGGAASVCSCSQVCETQALDFWLAGSRLSVDVSQDVRHLHVRAGRRAIPAEVEQGLEPQTLKGACKRGGYGHKS